MRAGDTVRHPELGKGTVKSFENRGADAGVIIDFGYMEDWVSARELGLDGFAAPAPDAQTADTSDCERRLPDMPQSIIEARQGVLALRLGQPLEAHVRRLSAGTERIEADMARIVSRAIGGDAGAVLVEGEWGSGKTHLLALLRAIASDEGMASSALILDGRSVRLSDPMALMSRILGSFRKPDEAAPRGFREWLPTLRKNSASWRPKTPGEKMLASAIRTIPENALADAEALQVLEDYFTLDLSKSQAQDKFRQLKYRYRGRLPSMKAHPVSERTDRFCELLQAWAVCALRVDAKGLLVIFDELDVEYACAAGWTAADVTQRARRAQLLSALARLVVSAKPLPLIVAFGSAPGNAGLAGDEDAVLDVQRRLGNAGLRTISAVQPDLEETRDLVMRVLALYEQAYPERMAAVGCKWIQRKLGALAERHYARRSTGGGAPVPRTIVREAVELLDIAPGIAAGNADA